ncbi:MAG: hypothetical protein J7L14_03065, partial [Candidatus Diapherotrites archaeon]|nr:hypothetical protein [Candidatus Diapherotrites archaeon]
YEGTQPVGYPTKEQLELWKVPSTNELQRFFKQRREEAEQILKRIEIDRSKLKPTEIDELAERKLQEQSGDEIELRMNRVFVEIARIKAHDLYERFARGELTIEQLFEELKRRRITYP